MGRPAARIDRRFTGVIRTSGSRRVFRFTPLRHSCSIVTMTVMARIGWMAVAVACATALAVVTGVFNPVEKVNGLWLIVAAVCFYVLAYRFYGRFIARRVLELDDARRTPAHRLQDGANFIPTRSEERRVG